MLNSLRKGAGTWVAKIFIAILVLSFAVWGIADIFSGYGSRVLAKVGDVEVSPQEYERVLQQQVNRLSAQVGQRITSEQIRTFGLGRQVLNRLITNAAVSSHAKQLGLGISDQSISDEIKKNQNFQGSDGKFSRIQFDEVLRNINMNENMYIAEQRVGAVRDQLILSLSSDLYVPKSMKSSLNHFDHDTRTLKYFVLPKTTIKKIKNPDEKTQQSFLDENKRLFTAPEFRKVGVLTLSPELVKKSLKITKEDIATSYNDRMDQFSIPGKRHIRRMSFLDPQTAKEARLELVGGADFMTVAKKHGFKKAGTDLGFIDKTSLLDPRVADSAFSLKQGDVSPLIETQLSNILLQVVAIKPGKITKKLEDVEKEIRTYLISERAADKIGSLQDTIEDDRAAGKSLSDIARDLELSYTVAEAVDRSGKNTKSDVIKSFAPDARLLKTIFESDIGVENEPIEATGGIINWPEVLGVTPERLKTLAEVKTQLISVWTERQRENRLSKIASGLIADLRDGKTMKKVARKYRAKVVKSKAFKRTEEHDDVPPAAVNQAFVLPADGVGMNSLPGGKGRIIFKVIKKGKAKELSGDEAKKLSSRISRDLENDVVAQYVADLRKTYGVTVNQQVLTRLNGAVQ